jgi:hypothetical protein
MKSIPWGLKATQFARLMSGLKSVCENLPNSDFFRSLFSRSHFKAVSYGLKAVSFKGFCRAESTLLGQKRCRG